MSQPPPDPSAAFRPHGRLRLRLGALGVAVVVLFVLLVLRLWALQVLNTRTFVAQAASNHEKQVIVRAPRGEILDDKGRVLVRNRVAYELDLDPGAVRDTARRHRLLLRVANMLDLEPRPLWERVDRELRMDPVAPVTLATDIDVQLKWYLQENPTIFHGLSGRAGAPALLPVSHARRAHLRAAQRDRAQAAEGSALPRLPPGRRDRPERRRAALRRIPARHRRRRRRDRRRVRPADRRGAARQGARAGPQRAPHDQPRHAAGGRAGAREGRARRRLGGRRRRRHRRDRPVQRRDPRARLVSHVRSQLVHLVPQAEVQAAAHAHLARGRRAGALPVARPRDRGALSGGLDVQALRGHRGRQGAAHQHRPDAALHAEGHLLPQGVPQLGPDVRRPHQPDRGARALVRHLLLQAGRPDLPRGRQAGPSAAELGVEVRLRQEDRHRHRRRGSGPAARPRLEDELLQEELLDRGHALVRPELAVRLELERGRRAQPLDRPGQPQRHAAAARGRVLRHRQRRHGRDAARRRGDPVAGRADAHPAEPGEGAHQHRRVVAELRAHGPAARHAPAERHRDQRVRAVRRPRGRQDGHRPARG